MTGDPERIEEVVGRVDSLVIPIEQVNILIYEQFI